MRLILLLIISLSTLVSCKDKLPDEPSCRSLKGIPISKHVEGVGELKVLRPNPVCMEEIGEAECGRCSWSVSDRVQYVGEGEKTWLKDLGEMKPWSQIQAEAILTPLGTAASHKAFVMNICKKYKNCGGEVDRWRIKFEALSAKDIKPSR